MNCLFCLVALSVVSNSSSSSLRQLWTSAATRSSGLGLSSFNAQNGSSAIPTFDWVHSVALFIERERVHGRGKWNGWMATDWLRLRASLFQGSHPGAEVGATVLLSGSWLSPTITAEAGSSGGDAFSRTRVVTKSPYLNPALIRGFSYDYDAAYVGLEFGARSFALSINLGLIRSENLHQSMPSVEAAASNPLPGIQSARSAEIGPAGKLALLIRM